MNDVRVAAFDDPRFEPDRLHAAARAVLTPLERVSMDKEFVAVWRECFGRWLPAYRRLTGVPRGGARVSVEEFEVVTLRNVGPAAPAEAVVRARLRLQRWPRVPLLGAFVRALQRGGPLLWLTLVAEPGKDWELTRVDAGAAGEYHLGAEAVPEPVRDPALQDAAIHELAEDDPVAEPGELIVLSEGDAGRRLLDLSLTDGRFAPAVLEASVRSLIRAWRGLAIGEQDGYDAFAAVSSYDIAEYARHADLPVTLRAIEVLAIVAEPRPAVFLRIAALVQLADGTDERKLWWKLELDDALEQHWRLADAYARPELRELRADPPDGV